VSFLYVFSFLHLFIDVFHRKVLFLCHGSSTEAGVDDDVLLSGPVLVAMGPDVLCPLVDESESFFLVFFSERHGASPCSVVAVFYLNTLLLLFVYDVRLPCLLMTVVPFL
jgi:hypothetical protein